MRVNAPAISKEPGKSLLPEDRIIAVLRPGETITVEEILDMVPEMSWVQIFLGVDILSRRGDVELRREGFTYTVRLLPTRSDGKGD